MCRFSIASCNFQVIAMSRAEAPAIYKIIHSYPRFRGFAIHPRDKALDRTIRWIMGTCSARIAVLQKSFVVRCTPVSNSAWTGLHQSTMPFSTRPLHICMRTQFLPGIFVLNVELHVARPANRATSTEAHDSGLAPFCNSVGSSMKQHGWS